MKDVITKAVHVLKKGGIIIYPTDTVWGLGCDATNTKAVNRLLAIKKRNNKFGLIILLKNYTQIRNYADFDSNLIVDLKLMKNITFIVPNGKNVATKVLGENKTLAIRVSKQIFCNNLLKNISFPIVSTSANIQGELTPVKFNCINKVILEKVDYVVPDKFNKGMLHKASRILKIDCEGRIQIIRE